MSAAHETRQAVQLTIGTWVLSGLLYLLPVQLFQGGPNAFTAASVVLICLCGTALSLAMFCAARRLRAHSRTVRIGAMTAAVALASLLLALGDAAMSSVVARWFDPGGSLPPFLLRAASNFTAFVWQFALLAAVYLVLEASRTARERERLLAEARAAAARAEAAASEARLTALRYQLNPHFLFNTLNAVSSLVVTRRIEEADAMLAKLSDFLRTTLTRSDDDQVTLEDELAKLQSYLEIESVRFRDRLAVDFDCPRALRDALVPGFILQPLVENAVKYAVSPADRQVTIRVEASAQGADLVVAIADDGDPRDCAAVPPGTGLGLVNVRQRLDALYGNSATLTTRRTSGGFEASIRLPLRLRAAEPARVA